MRKFRLRVLLGIILGIVLVSKNMKSNSICDNIELSNIEALASEENTPPYSTYCYDIGSIKCVDGGYVELIIFKLEEESSLY